MKKKMLVLFFSMFYAAASFGLWTYCNIPGQGGVSSIAVYFNAQEECVAEEYHAIYFYEDGHIEYEVSHMGTIDFGTWDCCPLY